MTRHPGNSSRVWPGSGSDPALGAPSAKKDSGEGEETVHQGRLEGLGDGEGRVGWVGWAGAKRLEKFNKHNNIII
jgi:hypothetical protein